MKSIGKLGLTSAAALAATLLLGAASQAATLNVDIYGVHGSDDGGGAPYSQKVGSFTSSDIMFATNTGYNWSPFGLTSFGADITGCINVAQDGDYTFALNSDDGSILLIDNALAVDNGGAHSPNVASNIVSLTAGMHQIEVQFYEDFGFPSGVDLYLPEGVTYGDCSRVPEPGVLSLVGGAMLSSVGLLARRRKR